MHKMTQAYLVAALWSSTDNTDDQGGEPLGANYDIADIAPESLEQAEKDCLTFLEENGDDVNGDFEQAGHDLWLTRNHHGAGFWDRGWKERGERLTAACRKYRELDAYIGDDGLIYFG